MPTNGVLFIVSVEWGGYFTVKILEGIRISLSGNRVVKF